MNYVHALWSAVYVKTYLEDSVDHIATCLVQRQDQACICRLMKVLLKHFIHFIVQ